MNQETQKPTEETILTTQEQLDGAAIATEALGAATAAKNATERAGSVLTVNKYGVVLTPSEVAEARDPANH